ncbi:MAG: RDD family protein [Gammaproteobacteria bacterium]
MARDSSPYSAPESDVQTNRDNFHEVHPAGNWKRFSNYLIDYIAIYFFSMIVGVAIVLLSGETGIQRLESITPIEEIALGFIVYSSYYLLFEFYTGKTIGKFITGTRVVNEHGGKPTFNQILGRSLSRLIPFEPLSFFGASGRGWHDRFSKTYVVETHTSGLEA